MGVTGNDVTNRSRPWDRVLQLIPGALSPLAQAVTTKEGGTTQQIPGCSQPANTTVGPGGSGGVWLALINLCVALGHLTVPIQA